MSGISPRHLVRTRGCLPVPNVQNRLGWRVWKVMGFGDRLAGDPAVADIQPVEEMEIPSQGLWPAVIGQGENER